MVSQDNFGLTSSLMRITLGKSEPSNWLDWKFILSFLNKRNWRCYLALFAALNLQGRNKVLLDFCNWTCRWKSDWTKLLAIWFIKSINWWLPDQICYSLKSNYPIILTDTKWNSLQTSYTFKNQRKSCK